MSHIHIPDGVLPLWLWAAGWVGALIVVAMAGRLADTEEARRKVPILGVVAALMLVAMSSEIVPIAYHINLTVLAAVLIGPVLALIAAFIVVTVLALLGHGGVTVIGLNTLVISAEMLAGWALFRAGAKLLGAKRVSLAAGGATVLALVLSTSLLVGIVWAGGSGATARETGALDPAELRFENPLSGGLFELGLLGDGHDEDAEDHADEGGLSVRRFAAVVFALGPAGWLIEALITAAIVGFVARVRPTLIFAGVLAEERRPAPGDETGRG